MSNALSAAGFSDAEIQEYQQLKSAGFSDKEIDDHYAEKKAASKFTSQSELVSRPFQDQLSPTTPVDKTDWKQVGSDVVHSIPTLAATAGTAGALAATPFSGGLSATLIPAIVGAGAYQAGRPVREAIETLLEIPPSDQGTIPETIGSINEGALATLGGDARAAEYVINKGADFLGRQVPNAAKYVAGKVGNAGQLPQRTAGRILRENPNSARVDVALKHKLDLAGGNHKAIGQAKQIRDTIWPEVSSLVDEATQANSGISRADAEGAVWNYIDDYARLAPGSYKSPEVASMIKMAERMQEYPEVLSPEHAQEIKQFIGAHVKNWETAPNQDFAQRPVIGVLKEFTKKLDDLIGDSTASPELYHNANARYGELADLLSKGKKSPLARGTNRVDVMPGRAKLLNQAKQAVGRPLYKMQQWAKTAEAAPTPKGVTQHIGSPMQQLEELFGVKYAKPNTSDVQFDARGSVLQDWPKQTEGLEPSEAAKAIGEHNRRRWAKDDYKAEQKMLTDRQIEKGLHDNRNHIDFGATPSFDQGQFPAFSTGAPNDISEATLPTLVDDIAERMRLGQGHTITAEEKLTLKEAMKESPIEIVSALTGKPPVSVDHPNPNASSYLDSILSTDEKLKYILDK